MTEPSRMGNDQLMEYRNHVQTVTDTIVSIRIAELYGQMPEAHKKSVVQTANVYLSEGRRGLTLT